MQVLPILHDHISLSLSKAGIRKTKQHALIDMTTSLLNDSKLSLTSIGRHMKGDAYVKHKIKRVDRWLGNSALYSQVFGIYQAIFTPLLSSRKELHILVDWSGCCNWTECCLRASLLYDGRSLTFYQEVHSTHEQQKGHVHNCFLKNLSRLIPKNCEITIVTDRGFQVPWFKSVLSLGWNFIGRVSKSYQFKLDNESDWRPLDTLYSTTTNKPTYVGPGKLSKSKPTEVYIHSFKGEAKGRKYKKPRNRPYYPHIQKVYKELHKTPWIIVTSISPKKLRSKKIIKIYHGRMQIEQNFRDDKNERWGFGMQFNRSGSKERIAILLLIAALASYILMLIGVAAEKANLHKKFQANTNKKRVLSFLFLAKQVMRHDGNVFSKKEILHSFQNIAEGTQ